MNTLFLLFTLITLIGIFYLLVKIKKETTNIMSTQAEFDAKITAANAALDAIGTSVTSEAQQIRDFIAANPSVDTSALDGVVGRLETVAGSVGEIFEPPAADPPAEETPVEEPPVVE